MWQRTLNGPDKTSPVGRTPATARCRRTPLPPLMIQAQTFCERLNNFRNALKKATRGLTIFSQFMVSRRLYGAGGVHQDNEPSSRFKFRVWPICPNQRRLHTISQRKFRCHRAKESRYEGILGNDIPTWHTRINADSGSCGIDTRQLSARLAPEICFGFIILSSGKMSLHWTLCS